MHWYTARQPHKFDVKPPAYLLERISDLHYVIDLANNSPSEARRVLAHVITNLNTHHDDQFVMPLSLASSKMIDNPTSSKEIIGKVIGMMLLAREELRRKEKTQPWKKKKD